MNCVYADKYIMIYVLLFPSLMQSDQSSKVSRSIIMFKFVPGFLFVTSLIPARAVASNGRTGAVVLVKSLNLLIFSSFRKK